MEEASPIDVEQSLISKVIETGDLKPAMEARIKASFFEDAEHSMVFGWMLDYWSRYTATPTRAALLREFPGYKLVSTQEPYEYYLHELQQMKKYGMIVDTIDDMRGPLEDHDIDLAAKIMARAMNDIQQEVTPFNIVDFTVNTAERLAYYNSLTELDNGMRGIPTGFPTIDLATSGLQPEQLVTLIGTPKAGKSVFLMMMLISVHLFGKRPLGVTFEMSNSEQQARHDAFRAGINYNRLVSGKLKPTELRKLKTMLHELESMPEMLWVHDPSSTTTVSSLSAQVAQYKPDVLFVDGTYLMDSEINGHEQGSPQALTDITRGLKRLAQRFKIPVVNTTQVLLSRYSGRRGLQLGGIGYTSSFGQDSDVVIGIEADPEEEVGQERERIMSIVAARNASRRKVRVSWDWENSVFIELEEDPDWGGDDED